MNKGKHKHVSKVSVVRQQNHKAKGTGSKIMKNDNNVQNEETAPAKLFSAGDQQP